MEKKPLNLLILEDNPNDAELAMRQLEQEGFSVKWTRVETEKAFQEGLKGNPDLILADYAVPSFGAIDALKIQQKSAPGIPLIITSDRIGEEAVVECMKSGAVDYVLKDRLFRLGTVAKRALEGTEECRERRQAQEALQEITYDLSERVKELNWVYAISKIIEKNDISLKETLEAILNLIPLACQYPQITCVRIIYEGEEFRTENFRESIWRQTSDITACGKRVGTLEVCYLEERPKGDQGPFLREERNLINIIAERLGRVIERKKVEEKLRESEERYRTMFQSAAEGIIVADTETKKFRYANSTICRMLAYTEEELTRMGVADIHPKEDLEYIISEFEARARGEKTLLPNIPCLRKDGTIIYVDINTTKAFIDGRECNVGFFEDITERKKTEEALLKSEREYRNLAEGLNVLVYRADPKTLGATYVNRAIKSIYGYTVKEWLENPRLWQTTIHADDKKRVIAKVKEARRKSRASVFGYRITKKDGTVRWVEDHISWEKDQQGKVVSMNGLIYDTTERKKAEQKLKESEERFRKLFEQSNDAIYIHDLEGRMLDANSRSCDMLGYDKDTLLKIPVPALHPEGELPASKKAFKRTKDKGSARFESKFKKSDGTVIDVDISSRIIDPGTGMVQGIARDITERKKAEKSLIASERLRALGEMAGGVAHDFNNLLAIILANAQLLESGLERYGKEEIRERLAAIVRTASQGGETVRRLQHFTGRAVSTREFTRIDLNEIVKSTLRSTSPRWKDEAEAKGITIAVKEELGKLPPLLGSRAELMEVLTNLIFNAVQAMPHGGKVTIKTEVKENDVHLYFADSGQGIPHRIKTRIFDPFFTTKGPKASGLGLSTSYGIIKRHKGDMKVESSKRKGTIFTISIPIPLKVPSEKEKLKPPGKISSQKILVIDDEEGIRDVLASILGNEGHRVTLAETARDGLDRFKKDDFDLVLTDLGMPEISGWQLAKRIKKINPSVPVVMITGWAIAIPKEKMKEKGVDLILSKPFDSTKVIREINAVIESKDR